ncbi:MAG TPA: hypothetical protein VND64_24925 [Pirellulales bacterium]|nr:hypothetical protein [Pirellulales bacterium]
MKMHDFFDEALAATETIQKAIVQERASVRDFEITNSSLAATDDRVPERSRVRACEGLAAFWGQYPRVSRLDDTTYGNDHPVLQFMERVYQFQTADRSRQGIGFVFDQMNAWLCSGHFANCDLALSMADVNRLDANLVLSFLTITHAASGKLPGSTTYYARAKKRLEQLRGKSYAQDLLSGLA